MSPEQFKLFIFLILVFLISYAAVHFFNRPRTKAERRKRANELIVRSRYRRVAWQHAVAGGGVSTGQRPVQPAGPRDRLSYVRPSFDGSGGFAAGKRPRF